MIRTRAFIETSLFKGRQLETDPDFFKRLILASDHDHLHEHSDSESTSDDATHFLAGRLTRPVHKGGSLLAHLNDEGSRVLE